MRVINFGLISIVMALVLLLLCVAAPTLGNRPNAHWALHVGAYSTVLFTSFIYLLLQIRTPAAPVKPNAIILATYIPAVILSAISGALWAVVGHVMDTEYVGLIAVLAPAIPSLVASYTLTLAITFFSFFHVGSRARSSRSAD